MSASTINLLKQSFTIMVVDDSEDIRDLLKWALNFRGYSVIEAVDGREAVEFAQSKCPDLILMDLNMPLLDGLAATQQIRECKELRKQVPILAVTAHDTYGMKEAALEAGCDGYLTKPIDLDKLDIILSRILNSGLS